jgi:hypothetical protein
MRRPAAWWSSKGSCRDPHLLGSAAGSVGAEARGWVASQSGSGAHGGGPTLRRPSPAQRSGSAQNRVRSMGMPRGYPVAHCLNSGRGSAAGLRHHGPQRTSRLAQIPEAVSPISWHIRVFREPKVRTSQALYAPETGLVGSAPPGRGKPGSLARITRAGAGRRDHTRRGPEGPPSVGSASSPSRSTQHGHRLTPATHMRATRRTAQVRVTP